MSIENASSLQEMDKLLTQVADYEEEMCEARENVKKYVRKSNMQEHKFLELCVGRKQMNIDWTRQNNKFSSIVFVFKK